MDHPLGGLEWGEAVVAAVVGVLVLFFIIAPIVGLLWARQIENRTTLVIGGGVFLLLADIVATLLVALGRQVASPADLGETELLVIALLLGVLVAWLPARFMAWFVDDPPAYDTAGELRHLNAPKGTLMPQQEKRLERWQKRGRR